MSKEIQEYKANQLSLNEISNISKVFHQSGMFNDINSQAQAIVKVMAGKELGISPIRSMTKIYMVKGQVTFGSDIFASQVKQSKEYDYRVKKLTNEECIISFMQLGNNGKWENIGESSFTIKDAKTAGVYREGSGWTKFPKNMLFARAISNGCRFYCPHLIGGGYIPEELGANERGVVIDVEENTPQDFTPEDEKKKTEEEKKAETSLIDNGDGTFSEPEEEPKEVDLSVQWTKEDDGIYTFKSESGSKIYQVVLPKDKETKASCNCPVAAECKHIQYAKILFLAEKLGIKVDLDVLNTKELRLEQIEELKAGLKEKNKEAK